MEKKCVNLIVVGGGAAGLFAAIHAKGPVVLLEKSQKLLSKVKISGGGRCNVTHNCFDPLELTRFYPRGSKELRGPFTRFGPANVIDWFASKGVKLKVEADNRIFPTTDSSDTIINALLESAKDVEIMRGAAVTDIARIGEGYRVELRSGEVLFANHVMLATGSAPAGHRLAKTLGHTIVPPVPSLFTFNIPNFALAHLSGISIPNATVSLPAFKAEAQGPLLITHFGLSGPAVLKLSAFCARDLNRVGYATECRIRWVENFSEITSYRDLDLPKNLTKGLCSLAGVDPGKNPLLLSKKEKNVLQETFLRTSFQTKGKTTHKQEFVTCGGVTLSEVNFKTMESRLSPGLFFGGEILDIDGVTGGFNFQAAWTTGYHVAQTINKVGVSDG